MTELGPSAAEGFLPAPVSLARGLARMRASAFAARRLPGQPLLSLVPVGRARAMTAASLPALPWGARWALGVIWGADGPPGAMGPVGPSGVAGGEVASTPTAARASVTTVSQAVRRSHGGLGDPVAVAGAAATPAPRETGRTDGARVTAAPLVERAPPPLRGLEATRAAEAAASMPSPLAPHAPGSTVAPSPSPRLVAASARAEAMASVPLAMWLVGARAPGRSPATAAAQVRAQTANPASPSALWATQIGHEMAKRSETSPGVVDQQPTSGSGEHLGSPNPHVATAPFMTPIGGGRVPTEDGIAGPRAPASLPFAGAAGAPRPLDPLTILPAANTSLPSRDPTPAPAAIVQLAEATQDLRDYVERELSEVNERVSRVARRPTMQAPSALAPAESGAARHMLGRMRAIMEEERFRSGKLR